MEAPPDVAQARQLALARAGDAQALEDLIRKASSARSAWQIGGAAR